MWILKSKVKNYMVKRKGELAQVRAVFFDAVGTLIHPDPPAPVVYRQVGKRYGSSLSVDEIATRFRTAWKREEVTDAAAAYRTSEAREIERWRNIVHDALPDVQSPEPCFQELFHHFAKPAAWRCEPETTSVLELLNRKGYLLGLASNYDRRLRSVLAGLTALRRVKHLAISSEIGWRKPAEEFFTCLCRMAAGKAADILYIGDDWDNDYEAARQAGLQSLLFAPGEKGMQANVRRITRLTEMLDYLD